MSLRSDIQYIYISICQSLSVCVRVSSGSALVSPSRGPNGLETLANQ